MLKDLASAALILAAPSIALAQEAQTIDASSVNLDDPSDVDALYVDILRAAEEVCADAEYVGIYDQVAKPRQFKQCVRWTVKNTIAASGSSHLLSTHEALPRSERYNVESAEEVRLARSGG